LLLQVSSAHSVPTGQFWQPLLPSHLPFVEQVLCAIILHTPRGSTVPAAIGVQRPIDEARLQLRHAPAQAVSQQTLSTQWLCWHSLSALHGWPSCFGPQVPTPRLLVIQAIPVSQSAAELQVLVHAPLAQRNGWQSWMPWARQVPSPLHVPAVLTLPMPEQVGSMHTVSRG
jgi:hypothetical protein